MDDRALMFESSSRTSGFHWLKSPSSRCVEDNISAIKMVEGIVPFLLDFQDCNVKKISINISFNHKNVLQRNSQLSKQLVCRNGSFPIQYQPLKVAYTCEKTSVHVRYTAIKQLSLHEPPS
jgi:hypothetical protein